MIDWADSQTHTINKRGNRNEENHNLEKAKEVSLGLDHLAEEVRAEVLESPSRLSPAPPLPCNEDGDAGNPAGEGNNTTTSSVQPPFYDDNQQSLNSMDGGSLWNLVIIKQ
ncbi:hypothetical protein GLOIN_2v1772519 [Rhizophagus irregularis DAOM 181602=DAOM 197198]|nr:hypothetical protein GLOIN_2v1772519 [Rhizophagus irregularis DAOM 181602=DAOM 197198]CAB4471058.1 unnamed protein product [Rhizophagus irregularis]